MELKKIIRSDKDRLFVLDNECFIIFTADDLTDEKPFIRIGNWIDLPPESIPLIENIIVTDSITGDPAREQFNIDPKYLSTNKYIGSRQVVQNFLNFQKNFGLDLNNVSIVDVEKDLPYLSKEKSISSKDSFLGIFYRNGNFRVVYKDNILFNLKEFEDEASSCINRHGIISDKNRDTVRYSGAGIILFDNSALYYKSRYFTLYQFPKEYLSDFYYLNIDPAKIREMILPVPNIANITGFIKWCSSRKSLVKVFCDSRDEFESMQKLFTDAVIKRENFHGHTIDTGNGLITENYPGSANEKLTYKSVAPSFKKLELAFVKEYTGIQEILNERLDGIIIPYSIYEQASLFFKSTLAPVMYVNDGNKNISKPKGRDIIILEPKIQYDFNKFDDLDNLIQNAQKLIQDKELKEHLDLKDIGGIKNILFRNNQLNTSDVEDKKDFLNSCSFLRIFLQTTTDRKFSSSIQQILQQAYSRLNKEGIFGKESEIIKISLYFYNNSIFEFCETIGKRQNREANVADAFSERINTDRIRFNELLALYKNTQNKTRKEFATLEGEIRKRKEIYHTEEIFFDRKEIKRTILKKRLKKISKIILIILIIALLSFLSVKGFNYSKKYIETKRIEKERLVKIETERKRVEKEQNEKKELIEKYKIHVSDRDIYAYANRVAKKNGYREITYKDLKENNPNWIFPGNIFYLIDDEKVIVKAGDTLWDISDKKLMQMNIEFYKTIEKIEKAKTKNEKLELLKKAAGLAFSKKQSGKVEEIKKELAY